MNMTGPLAQGAFAAARAEVTKNVFPHEPVMIDNVIEWAVGAALRHLVKAVAEPESTTTKPVRVNEPTQGVTDIGGDPLAIAKARGFTGDMCRTCGSMDMVRTGTCSTCSSCGSSSGGCS